MKLKFDETEADQMRHVQEQITKAILPFRENTEAALVVFALLRCAKILLDLYNPLARGEMTEVVVAFLANDSRIIDPGTKGLLDRFLKH